MIDRASAQGIAEEQEQLPAEDSRRDAEETQPETEPHAEETQADTEELQPETLPDAGETRTETQPETQMTAMEEAAQDEVIQDAVSITVNVNPGECSMVLRQVAPKIAEGKSATVRPPAVCVIYCTGRDNI